MPPRSIDRRTRKSWRAGWLAAGLGVLALVTLVATFDWTWFRPLIQQHIQQRSGRRVDFDHLQVGLDSHLAPIVRVRNLRIQNAPWAALQQPLIQAGDLSATFEWASLFHGERIVITRMRLIDAEVDLEQQADGLRNWRITRPDDRGPGRIRVQTLETERSRAHYSHGGLQLDLLLQTDALAPAQVLPSQPARPLTKTLMVRGTRHAAPFDASFAVSDVISLFDSNLPFALRGEIGTRAARVHLQGEGRDLLQLGGFDLDVQASGDQLLRLAPLFGRPVPTFPVLDATLVAHARKHGRAWDVSQIVAHVGRSDLSGSLDYLAADRDGAGSAPGATAQLHAALASQRIDLAEWRAGRSVAPAAATPASAASAASTAPAVARAPLDAQVDWQVAQLDGLPLPLKDLRAHAGWRDQRLTLAPLTFAVAGGTVSGELSLAPSASSADMQLAGLRLDQLRVSGLGGRLNAHVALRSSGDSVDDLLAGLGGSAEADLQGATLPATLDAKLGLDAGRWLRSAIAGRDQRNAVLCSAMLMRFEKGIGTLQRLALETEQVLLNGSGSIDLPRRRVQLVLTPHRKQRALLALDDSIHVDGAMTAPSITLARRPDDAAHATGCRSTASG